MNDQAKIDLETDRPKNQASLFRWATLLARIFEVLPLCCPKCNHPMRIISFIKDPHKNVQNRVEGFFRADYQHISIQIIVHILINDHQA